MALCVYRDTSSEKGAWILQRLQQALENRRAAKVDMHTTHTVYMHSLHTVPRLLKHYINLHQYNVYSLQL
jgi:hypothetical protein